MKYFLYHMFITYIVIPIAWTYEQIEYYCWRINRYIFHKNKLY